MSRLRPRDKWTNFIGWAFAAVNLFGLVAVLTYAAIQIIESMGG